MLNDFAICNMTFCHFSKGVSVVLYKVDTLKHTKIKLNCRFSVSFDDFSNFVERRACLEINVLFHFGRGVLLVSFMFVWLPSNQDIKVRVVHATTEMQWRPMSATTKNRAQTSLVEA